MSEALNFQKRVMSDHFKKITNCSHNGVCSKCGGCCSDIFPLTNKEIDTLRHFVQDHNYKANTRLSVLAVNGYDMTCPFLNKQNECDIYAIRPEVCRLFHCGQPTPINTPIEKLPKDLRVRYFKLAAEGAESRSVRKEVFGEVVPF